MVEAEAMEYRSLGNSGLKVSALSFGTMTQGWAPGLEDFSYQCVERCIRKGINTFDTAEFYGNGLAETVFGNNLKQGGWEREDLVITCKIMPKNGGNVVC
jgi:aryl-alcohol dehydrogenase-like predicted oxidoreductase